MKHWTVPVAQPQHICSNEKKKKKKKKKKKDKNRISIYNLCIIQKSSPSHPLSLYLLLT
jgi:hypothetical protein